MGIVFPTICNRKPNRTQTDFSLMLCPSMVEMFDLLCWYAICRLVKCHDLLDESPMSNNKHIANIKWEHITCDYIVNCCCCYMFAVECQGNENVQPTTRRRYEVLLCVFFCFTSFSALFILYPVDSSGFIWFLYLLFVAEQLNDIERLYNNEL